MDGVRSVEMQRLSDFAAGLLRAASAPDVPFGAVPTMAMAVVRARCSAPETIRDGHERALWTIRSRTPQHLRDAGTELLAQRPASVNGARSAFERLLHPAEGLLHTSDQCVGTSGYGVVDELLPAFAR